MLDLGDDDDDDDLGFRAQQLLWLYSAHNLSIKKIYLLNMVTVGI